MGLWQMISTNANILAEDLGLQMPQYKTMS